MVSKSLYIASRYSRRDEMREVAKRLEEYGVVVTSSWLKEDFPLNVKMDDITPSDHRKIATVDLADIIRADGMLFFAEDQHNQPPRGGRHVEFGYALAQGLQMYVVGDHENIFHYLPNVLVFPTLEVFFEHEFTGA